MIFIHELGHYLMAKILGIRVEVFSLGFGPRLIGFKYGDTDYRISALPLGGFVKMLGENYDEELRGSGDEFLSRPKSHRFAVAVAGPVMNLILAVVLLTSIYTVGIQVPAYLSQPPVVGYVAAESPAVDAGLEEGDKILSVGDVATPTWESLQLAVATTPGQTVEVRIERAGQEYQKIVHISEDQTSGAGFMGVLPPSQAMVSGVEESGPAAQAGLKPGDIIVSASSDGGKTDKYDQILAVIAASNGRPVDFEIKRGDETFSRAITPIEIEGRTRVGVVIGPVPILESRTEHYGLATALGKSVERNWQLTLLTFRIVGKLVTGQTSLKMMSGPIEIARVSGQAASQGPLALVSFMSLISLQLGIFNLLPIPILDGGTIFLMLIESVIGRDLSMKAKERIFQVGFIFLILLMGIVIFNDIAKIF
jgi:regulator of sigma E protease